MAKLTGIIQLQGTLGNVTFSPNEGFIVAKAKSSLNAARMEANPNYELLRGRNTEFGRASAAAKLIRLSLAPVLDGRDSALCCRMNREVYQCLRADPVSPHGERMPVPGMPVLPEGFSFNTRTALRTTFRGTFTPVADFFSLAIR